MIWSLVCSLALADDVPVEPVVPPAEPPVVPEILPPTPPALPPRPEVRESYDASGRLTRRLELQGDRLVTETVFAYDEAGHVLTQTVIADGRTTTQTWTYTPEGQVATAATAVDGLVIRKESWTYAGDRPATRTVEADAQVRTTSWTWDPYGTATLIETRDVAGNVIDRTVADRQPPPPVPFVPAPISFAITGGVGSNSDVRVTNLSVGFALARKPSPDQYDKDPLEVRFAGSYDYGRSKETKTNDDLKLNFGIDYNHVAPRTTVFMYGAIERNPVANMNISVQVAPIGLKYDILDGSNGWLIDASFAPVWDYRSIVVAADGDCEGTIVDETTNCDFSRVRGSFRARFGYASGPFKIANTFEFLPALNPKEGSILDAIPTESVTRDTLAIDVKLSQRLTLSQGVVFTRDMLLKGQADCTADPENLLCDGMSLQTGTKVTLTLDRKRP